MGEDDYKISTWDEENLSPIWLKALMHMSPF